MQYTKSLLLTLLVLVLFGTSLVAQKASLPCLNKEFNVVAHIVKTESDSLGVEIDSLFAVMARVNELFKPICVSFNICEIDTIDNWQYDTVQTYEWDEMQVLYHQQRKINIFWVNQFEFENELCGVTQLGGINNTENGGLLMMKGDCVNEFAIAHELGRFFGVPWTFGEGEERTEELVGRENCETTGDMICDTPADPYIRGMEVSSYVDEGNNCRFVNQERDGANDWYTPHVANIMSYYPDACKCDFTDGQYRVMVETYLASSPKMY